MSRLGKVWNYLGTSKRFSGGLILNILGYQIVRIIFYKITFALRKRRTPRDGRAKELMQGMLADGIVIIPDFFSTEVFEEIKNECYSLELRVHNERRPRMMRGTRPEGSTELSKIFEKHFTENDVVNDAVAGILRKDILVAPTVTFERSSCSIEDLNQPSIETTDNLHFDLSFPTIKCFYYVNDVDEENAAFTFVKRSHKMTLARLWMEYKMSVMFMSWNKEKQATMCPEVPLSFIEKNNLELTPVVGKANTLVIANIMGFHRRGDFASTKPREMVIVNYRGLDTLTFYKKSFLKMFGK